MIELCRDKGGQYDIYVTIGIHILVGVLLISVGNVYYHVPYIVDCLWGVVVFFSWHIYWYPTLKCAKDRIEIGQEGVSVSKKSCKSQSLLWDNVSEIGFYLWCKPLLMRGENLYNTSRLYFYCANHELNLIERCMLGTIWQYRLTNKGVIFFRCEGIFHDGTRQTIDIDAAIVNRIDIKYFNKRHFQKFPLEKRCIYANNSGEHSIALNDCQKLCKAQQRHNWMLIVSSPYIWLWIGILSAMIHL